MTIRAVASFVIFAVAVGLAITIGFVGAPRHEQFDWRLCAEVGTALGTLLLAGFTAWLAATTRREVKLSIEQEAARSRPAVIVTPLGFGKAVLDPVSGETVSTLAIVIRNVGLGPALDLRVRAKHADHVSSPEVISVVAVREEIRDRAISLGAIPEPPGGFALANLNVEGDFEDRTSATRQDVTVLLDQGLTDEVLAARALASRRAWFDLIPGKFGEVTYRREKVVQYRPLLQNRGPAAAERVMLELIAYDDRTRVYASEPAVRMEPNTAQEIVIRLASPQLALSCRVFVA